MAKLLVSDKELIRNKFVQKAGKRNQKQSCLCSRPYQHRKAITRQLPGSL